ncbi:MAG: hypothetical protein J6X18_09050 [Bacteroidales bacterium]|nr:hypothetical protein [Bacteroidales bacterium]
MKRIAIELNDVIRDYTGQFIECYKKQVDEKYEKEIGDVDSFDFYEVFPFDSRLEYQEFRYTDAAYDLNALAPLVDARLQGLLNNWTENILKNLDVDEDPDVVFFSALEIGPTIPATHGFLSDKGFKVREYYFPIDSSTIYDRCDIVITANPNIISKCPEGRTVIKIDAPYNKEVECELSFPSLYDLLTDSDNTLVKMIENE